MLVTVDNQSATRLLRIYGIKPPVADDDFTPGEDAAHIPATIDGVISSGGSRTIRLKINGRRCSREIPLSEAEAHALIDEVQGEQSVPADQRIQRTLVPLLTKCAKLYEDSGVSELHLVLYLTPNGYRTHAVYMLRPRTVVGRTSRGLTSFR